MENNKKWCTKKKYILVVNNDHNNSSKEYIRKVSEYITQVFSYSRKIFDNTWVIKLDNDLDMNDLSKTLITLNSSKEDNSKEGSSKEHNFYIVEVGNNMAMTTPKNIVEWICYQ